MTTRYRVAGINFAHMHMGDNLRFAFDHPDVDLVGICDEEPTRMESAIEAFGLGSGQVFTDWQRCLAESLPDLESEPGHLPTIPGMVPSAVDFAEGCRFRDRCSYATEACVVQPETTQLSDNHVAACHHLDAVQAAREGTS